MKNLCRKCGEVKEFYSKSTRCKECLGAYHKQWRERNPNYGREYNKTYKTKASQLRERLSATKLSRGCIDCGYKAYAVSLHFDHRDPKLKLFNLSSVPASTPWEVIEAEIAKCDVRCANCHAVKTLINRDYYKGTDAA